jgi:hypothetical protein
VKVIGHHNLIPINVNENSGGKVFIGGDMLFTGRRTSPEVEQKPGRGEKYRNDPRRRSADISLTGGEDGVICCSFLTIVMTSQKSGPLRKTRSIKLLC